MLIEMSRESPGQDGGTGAASVWLVEDLSRLKLDSILEKRWGREGRKKKKDEKGDTEMERNSSEITKKLKACLQSVEAEMMQKVWGGDKRCAAP